MNLFGGKLPEAGGRFEGFPTTVFLYRYMLDLPWPMYWPERPHAELFDGEHVLLLRRVSYFPSFSEIAESANPGEVSDGGTIPRIAWGLTSTPFRNFLLGYFIHDRISKDARILNMNDCHKMAVARRLFGDQLLYVMVKDLGGSESRARRIYRGVRLGAMGSGLWR